MNIRFVSVCYRLHEASARFVVTADVQKPGRESFERVYFTTDSDSPDSKFGSLRRPNEVFNCIDYNDALDHRPNSLAQILLRMSDSKADAFLREVGDKVRQFWSKVPRAEKIAMKERFERRQRKEMTAEWLHAFHEALGHLVHLGYPIGKLVRALEKERENTPTAGHERQPTPSPAGPAGRAPQGGDVSRPLDFPCKGCGAPAGAPCRKPSGVKTRAHAERRRLAVPEANIAETEFGTKPEAEAFLRGVRFAAMGAGVFDVVGVEQRKGRFFALVQVNRA